MTVRLEQDNHNDYPVADKNSKLVENGLVILQTTSFCNINCEYCYLGGRDKYNLMKSQTVKRIAERIFESPFFPEEANLIWHAGEPLTVPISFYEEAIAIFNDLNKRGINLNWGVQTNGTLINPDWCKFFKRHNFDVGVSIDGPERTHDLVRVDRRGKGTYKQVSRGIRLLHEFGIDFGILSTIGKQNILSPQELWALIKDNRISRIGFNEEEISGVNNSTSLSYEGVEADYARFLAEMLRLRDEAQMDGVRIRELDRMKDRVLYSTLPIQSDLLTPFKTLSFDWLGNFSTFSPELLSLEHNSYGDFKFGNVYVNSLVDICSSDKFKKAYDDIQAGVDSCRNTCDYFAVCAGGNPSTKLGEHGTFDATETLSCRLGIKTLFDVVSSNLESQVT